MKLLQKLAIALLLVAPAVGATGQADQQHQQHHPETAATPVMPAPAPKVQPGNDMTMQLDSMRKMHERMLAAKTPAERNALMADHMKAMKAGMATLSASAEDAAGRCEHERESHMEQRMQMMEMMLQLMMDRMPAAQD